MENQKIVIIGCGNVASYFAERFSQHKHTILQVYHPEIDKAKAFAIPYQAEAINDFTKITLQADLYFIAVKDDAIAGISNQLNIESGLVLHTSGAVKLEALNRHKRSAVFYPLQTFTKGIKTANQNFPMLIECGNKEDEKYLAALAISLGKTVQFLNSAQRTEIHLAAVFAANFSNHCIKIAYDLMADKKHEAQLLLPLIKESIHKLNFINPAKAQTGPAIRHDEATIEKHLNMLKNDEALRLIYELMTKSIQSNHS